MKITPRNRREILALGAGAIAFAGAAQAQDASYDILIKGGRVIDPAQGMNAIGDVAISGGKVAAIAPSIAGKGDYTLDATNKLVVPGLIDIHSHNTLGSPGSPISELLDGVTSWVDAGSNGADNIEKGVRFIRNGVPQTALLQISISRAGLAALNGNRALLDVAACRKAIEAHRDLIVGVGEVRLSKAVAGDLDLEMVRRAEEATAPYDLPVMLHIGDDYSPLGQALNLLKPGDIVSHVLAPPPNNIFDANGKLIPELIAARARGVKFDVGHGLENHFSWEVADRALQQGFFPETTSTDWTKKGHDTGRVAMPEMLTNLLAVGLPVERAIAMATINAANCFTKLKGRGTLRAGSPADVTILELRQGNFVLLDSATDPVKRPYTQKFFVNTTVIGGKVWYQA